MKKNVENEESLNLKPSIPVIGIDLGTTFSCVGTWKIGKVEIIINECGEKTTPSIVSFLKNEIPVGTPAISSLIENPKNTIYDSKRLIGRRFNDKIVQEEIKYWDFKIEENLTNGKPEYVIQIDDKEERYFPEEISSLIIKKVYSFAQEFTNKDKLKAVITVPAQFTNGQRESTKKAAEMAGLEVIRIINEPTAAAIGYLFSKDKDINNVNFVYENNQYHKVRYILVFDLGGGTFDTSIVKVEKKTFEVIATCGDNHLGGEDFTNKLTDYLINCLKEEEGYEDIDFKDKNNENTFKAFQKLRREAEKVKKNLSFTFEEKIFIENLYNNKNFKFKITRSEYENECEEIFQKCFKSIDKVLELAKLKKEDINEIALSGGSSRTPRIKEMIKEYFNKEPLKTINPDEAIAYGATIVACIESGTEIEDKELLELKELKIIDITSCSIGIELADGKMEVIIPKGIKLPENGKTKLFRKICKPEFNCGSECILSLFEGENKLVKFNYKLGEYRFRLLEKNENTMKIIKILFKLTSDSIITIIVEENEEKLIEVKSSEIYPNEILIRFVKHIHMFEQLEKETKKKEQLKKTFNQVLKELNKIFESYKLDNENIKKDIETQITKFTKWNRYNKDSKSSEYNKKIEEIKELIAKIKLEKIQTPRDNFY